MTLSNRFFSFLLVFSVVLMVGCAGSDTSRSTGTYIDDKTISTKVKAQLAEDKMTSAIDIEVETYDGVVQLSGFVANPEMVQRAEEIARGVTGVKQVKNALLVR